MALAHIIDTVRTHPEVPWLSHTTTATTTTAPYTPATTTTNNTNTTNNTTSITTSSKKTTPTGYTSSEPVSTKKLTPASVLDLNSDNLPNIPIQRVPIPVPESISYIVYFLSNLDMNILIDNISEYNTSKLLYAQIQFINIVLYTLYDTFNSCTTVNSTSSSSSSMNATSAASTSEASGGGATSAAVSPMPFIDLNTLSNRWSNSNSNNTGYNNNNNNKHSFTAHTSSEKHTNSSSNNKYANNNNTNYVDSNDNNEYMIDFEERIQSNFISNKYYILYQKLILNYTEINGKLGRFLVHILEQITSNILKSKIILCIHILCKIDFNNIIIIFNDYKISYIIQKLLEPLVLHTSLLPGTTQTSPVPVPVPVVPITYPILSCMSIIVYIKEYSIYSIRIIRSELACICNAKNDILSPQNTLNSALNPSLKSHTKNKNKINLLLFENAIQYMTTILSIISIHPILRRIILCTIPLPTSNHLISIVSQALNFTTQVCI